MRWSTLPSSHIVKAKLSKKKIKFRLPAYKHYKQLHIFRNFLPKCCHMQIWDPLWSDKREKKLQSGGCLQFVLVFNSFIIKCFSLTALCWTLGCNAGLNRSTEIPAYNYVFISCSLIFTHTHTCRLFFRCKV